MKTAIFLGAGASAADNAPVQSQLLYQYFDNCSREGIHTNIENELMAYFRSIFGVDFNTPRLDQTQFPTFEEAIGMLDLAEIRNESFKGIDRGGITSDSEIRKFREHLIYALATVIDEQTGTPTGAATCHDLLIKHLTKEDLLHDVFFISSNYDILIDNTLGRSGENPLAGEKVVDYGISFVNQNPSEYPDYRSIPLFKIHGSLNWLYCSTCNDMSITPFQKGAAHVVRNPDEATCWRCGTQRSPIIIPPSFYKDMSNVYLSGIWSKAESKLREADHIIFCGYSFPPADTHIKYLLKRAETNRDQAEVNVTVFNSHDGKDERDEDTEAERYDRFFIGSVNYTEHDFEYFAYNPEEFI